MSRVRVIEIMRRGPRGAPGDMDPAEWDALQADIDAKLPIADVLNEPDMATGATDKPPSQASVVEYVTDGLATKVTKTGDESIAGVKTFTSSPVVPDPTTAQQAASKEYVDVGLSTKLDDTISPALIMSPDQTRDRRGTVTPSTTGTVTTVAGQYGDAWSLGSADAAVRVPKGTRWPVNTGTVLVRARLTGAPSGDPYSIDVNGASPNRFRMGISSTSNPRVVIGDANYTETFSPAPDYTEMHVHAVRFDSGTVQQFIDGTPGAVHSYSGSADGSSPDIRVSILIPDSTPYDVESVLIYPYAIPDSEIERLSTMEAAWTWETARLRSPDLIDIEAEVDAVLAGVLARLMPAGGNPGQMLGKITGDDYDAEWMTPPGVVEPTLLVSFADEASAYGRTGPFTPTTSGPLRFEEVS